MFSPPRQHTSCSSPVISAGASIANLLHRARRPRILEHPCASWFWDVPKIQTLKAQPRTAETEGTARCGDCGSGLHCDTPMLGSRFHCSVPQISYGCCPSQVAARDPSCFTPLLHVLWSSSHADAIRAWMRPERGSGTLRSEGAVPCSAQSAGDFCREEEVIVSESTASTGILRSSMTPSM